VPTTRRRASARSGAEAPTGRARRSLGRAGAGPPNRAPTGGPGHAELHEHGRPTDRSLVKCRVLRR
jgi:hypothetical protein